MTIRGRLTSVGGFTIVEVVVAMLVLSLGITSTVKIFSKTNRATLNVQRNEAALAVAQREMEELRTLRFGDLGINGAPEICLTAGKACKRASVTGSPSCERFQLTSALYEPIVMATNACQTMDPADTFKVAPFRDVSVVVSGTPVTMHVTHYVTWRNESCSGACPGTSNDQDTKRLVVAVTPDKGVDRVDPSGSAKPVWVSSVAINPNARPTGVDGTPTPLAAKTQASKYFLHDKQCTAGATGPSSHASRDTALDGGTTATRATCTGASSSHPDLMDTSAPAQPASDPIQNYSNEASAGPGGLQIATSANCPQSYAATAAKNTVHTWATPSLAASQIKGPIIFTFYAATTAATATDERVCLSLSQRNANGDVGPSATVNLLGSDTDTPCTQSVVSWTQDSRVDEFTCSFTLDYLKGFQDSADGSYGWNVLAGRLALTLSTADSGSPLRLLYDHPTYPTNLRITTCISPGTDTNGAPTCN